ILVSAPEICFQYAMSTFSVHSGDCAELSGTHVAQPVLGRPVHLWGDGGREEFRRLADIGRSTFPLPERNSLNGAGATMFRVFSVEPWNLRLSRSRASLPLRCPRVGECNPFGPVSANVQKIIPTQKDP
ncbi:hypothetical protein, partial [Nocardiopsis sp. TNDT3]|uniref:hypothetical protein n=1 Tax=Nocardiopsis sp. TNDT3 TaxID=2249354 RepID=UPI001E4073D0